LTEPQPEKTPLEDLIIEEETKDDSHQFDDDGNLVSIEHDDGSITVSLNGPLAAAEEDNPPGWFDNLVDRIDDFELSRIADDLLRGIDDDLAQRLLAQRAAGESQGPEPVWGATLRVAEEHAEGAEERAARAALSKLRLRGGDARAEVQRLAQGLARRGFPSALSWRLARERVESEAQAPVTEGDPEGE
jgi:hypothetical protein